MRLFVKHIFIIFIAINIVSDAYGQELVESINSAYKNIDTTQYIDDIKLYIYNDIESWHKKSLENIMESYNNIYKKNIVDSVKRMYLLDSMRIVQNLIWEKETKKRYNDFISSVNDSRKMEFVLNLYIEKDTINGNILYSIKPDTGKFIFNVWFFGKYQHPYYVVSVENGEYIGHGLHVVYSRKSAKMLSKSFQQIMKIKPDYLLFCRELEGMNSILYVVNDKIYVYRTIEMKEYELSDYVSLVITDRLKRKGYIPDSVLVGK